MKFAVNMNEYVWVHLNDRGRDILAGIEKQLQERIPNYEPHWPKPNEAGWAKWQLWELFSRFGEHISMGMNTPFSTEIIIGDEPKEPPLIVRDLKKALKSAQEMHSDLSGLISKVSYAQHLSEEGDPEPLDDALEKLGEVMGNGVMASYRDEFAEALGEESSS